MSKRRILIFTITLLFLVFIFGGIYFLKKPTASPLVQPSSNQAEVSPATEPEVVWDDPAGFTFNYFKTLTIDKHDEDQQNYAHVEITDQSHPGHIIVWAKDTTAADVIAWIRTEKTYKDANVIDTTFGGQPAKKIVLDGEIKQLITGTIYDGLLFMVECTGTDQDFWASRCQLITDSFQFKPLENESNTAPDTSGGNSGSGVDEEEVLE